MSPFSDCRRQHWGIICLVVILFLKPGTTARKWEDIVAVAIYARSNVDTDRLMHAMEEDPLEKTNVIADKETEEQSSPPSDMPSTMPSIFEEDTQQHDENNDGAVPLDCPPGTSLYKVNMFDSWGDGWGATSIALRQMDDDHDEEESSEPLTGYLGSVVSTAQTAAASLGQTEKVSKNIQLDGSARDGEDTEELGTANRQLGYVMVSGLSSGLSGSQYVCLFTSKCYEVLVQGGKWQEEIRWEIVPAFEDTPPTGSSLPLPIASGSAPTNCTFSTTFDNSTITNSTACPLTCQDVENDDTIRTKSLAASSTSEEQTPTTTSSPMPVNTLTPSFVPSDAPSLVPTIPH